MTKILLLGGTGFVGSHLCEKLARQLFRVTIATRRAEHANQIQHLPGLEVATVNVMDDAQLGRLVAGHDAVVNLIAILHGDEAAFTRMHVDLPQKLAQACLKAGVKRVVHVSALGAGLKAPSMYQRSKARGEQVLRAAALDLTVLRPSVIFGEGDKFLTVFAKLQKMLPVMPLAGADTRFQPVWVEDVADAIVHCLRTPATSGQTYDLCGPDVFTLRELVRFAGCVSGANHGQGRPVLALPEALGRLQAALMSLAPGEPLMSRDNLDSMKVDNVSDGVLPGLAALGIDAASLPAIVPGYLGKRAPEVAFLSLRKSAGRD